ncbi:MAG TPA: GNAT family protein [Actinomycetota bacterium]|nr:GNAT family protein [Actinomycetota bacterium]
MTARSSIRPWRTDDLESLVRHANNKAIWLNLRDRFPHPYTRTDAEEFLARAASMQPQIFFAIDHEGQAVGGIGIDPAEDVERVSGELGYWVGQQFWGQGLATQAAREMTTYCFDILNLHRVWAGAFARNQASIKVLEKLGFRREGVLKESIIKDGRLESQIIYAITAPEWKRLTA